MLKDELENAIRLAVEAGQVISEYYLLDVTAEEKTSVDNFAEPVTVADRDASRIIVDGLAALFPRDGILSEEEADEIESRLTRERVWMIDPIDGTAGFIKKDGDFAVQIGLSVGGQPVLGVVYLPAHETLYFAVKGEGSFIEANGGKPQAIRVSSKTDFSEMNIAVSRDHRSPKMSRIIKELGLRKEIGRGSVGVKIGMIAEQECDLYIHLSHRTKFWDTCAPQIILEEAGGRLTDLFGNEFRYDLDNVMNLNGIVASNGIAHELTLEKLAPILSEVGRNKILQATPPSLL